MRSQVLSLLPLLGVALTLSISKDCTEVTVDAEPGDVYGTHLLCKNCFMTLEDDKILSQVGDCLSYDLEGKRYHPDLHLDVPGCIMTFSGGRKVVGRGNLCKQVEALVKSRNRASKAFQARDLLFPRLPTNPSISKDCLELYINPSDGLDRFICGGFCCMSLQNHMIWRANGDCMPYDIEGRKYHPDVQLDVHGCLVKYLGGRVYAAKGERCQDVVSTIESRNGTSKAIQARDFPELPEGCEPISNMEEDMLVQCEDTKHTYFYSHDGRLVKVFVEANGQTIELHNDTSAEVIRDHRPSQKGNDTKIPNPDDIRDYSKGKI